VQSPGNPQSLARYSYALNNPLAYIDPTGHFSIGSFFGSLFGGLLGGLTFAFTDNPVLAGMVAGGVSVAFYGNPGNAIMGAAMGGFSGALGSVVQANFGAAGSIAMVGAGPGLAVARGGWSSLAYMGAGMVGGAIGYNLPGLLNGSSGPAATGGSDRDRDYASTMKQLDELNRSPGLSSAETSAKQSQLEDDSYAQGRYISGAGVWNAQNSGDPIYLQLGDTVHITVHNYNIIPTPIFITANDMTQGYLLGPLFGSHEFTFYNFGTVPQTWNISASLPRWGVVPYTIESNWVPH
jgi:hypothetical protein